MPRRIAYGNSIDYLVARIARDRPDILERMKAGEYNALTVTRAAKDAGIIRATPPKEDRALMRLVGAWFAADLESRRIFLALLDDEIEAAHEGKYLTPPRRPGPSPFVLAVTPAPGVDLGDLEALLLEGKTVSEVARALGVTYRTVARWRAGKTAPSRAVQERLAELRASWPVGA